MKPVLFLAAVFTLSSFLVHRPEPAVQPSIKLFADGAMSEGGEADARYRWELMRLADPRQFDIKDKTLPCQSELTRRLLS